MYQHYIAVINLAYSQTKDFEATPAHYQKLMSSTPREVMENFLATITNTSPSGKFTPDLEAKFPNLSSCIEDDPSILEVALFTGSLLDHSIDQIPNVSRTVSWAFFSLLLAYINDISTPEIVQSINELCKYSNEYSELIRESTKPAT